MTSSYHVVVVVLLMSWSTTISAQQNSTLQQGNDTAQLPGWVKAVNKMSNVTNCPFPKVHESKIEELLHLQHEPTINVVKMKIAVVSGNKTRYFHFTWASEIGRTIMTLVRYAEDTVFSSPVFTWALKVGTAEVDIKLNDNDSCLPPGNNGRTEIFDILLREIFSHSKDTHLYKLCRLHDDGSIPFNCCRIIGGENLPICADYSSVVVDLSLPAIIVTCLVSFLFVSLFVVEYIRTYPSNKPGFYKTSESHMCLTSIFSLILFESRGPVKSLFRRSVFAMLSFSLFYPADFFGYFCLKVVFWIWFGVFVVTDDAQMTYDECKEECTELCKCKFKEKCIRRQWINIIIQSFTFPFSIVVKSMKQIDSFFKDKLRDILEWCEKRSWPEEKFFKLFCYIFYFLCRAVSPIIIILFPVLALVLAIILTTFGVLFWILTFSLSHPFLICNQCLLQARKCLMVLVRLPTIINILFFTEMSVMFALFMVVGFSLNAEFFNPYIAPFLSLLLYFWKNWKLSVEGRCLQLKTSIIEVCKEKAPPIEDRKKPQVLKLRLRDNLQSKPDDSEFSLSRICSSICCRKCRQDNVCVTTNNPATSAEGSSESQVEMEDLNAAKGPTITKIEPTATSLQVTWEKPSDNNLSITKYEVCCKCHETVDGAETSMINDSEPAETSTKEDIERITSTATSIQVTSNEPNVDDSHYKVCYEGFVTVDGADTTMVKLTGLKPATKYTVTVRAVTDTGEKIPGNLSFAKTNESEPIIKFDEHGEALIATKLYDDICQKILPLDRLLFFFFRRLIFVTIYAFAFFVAMSFGQQSGIPEGVQAISAIAGVMLPFIFDTILAEHQLTQRNANNLAMKDKLWHTLEAKRVENNDIFVELNRAERGCE